MPKLKTIRLRCLDPKAQKRFYCEALGMGERADGTVGYGEQEAGLLFEAAETPYEPTPHDLYWKIAISVPNIELAHRQLAAQGVDVGEPRQFQQIAYLAHFRDPAGFTVELLDHRFKGERLAEDVDDQKLGGGPHLNLLTLRSGDIQEVEQTCSAWGLKALSIQPVPGRGFTLHFYAFTDDSPPDSDLYAIENRTWVYRRPYTVLEIQHVGALARTSLPGPTESGYAGATISGASETFGDGRLAMSFSGSGRSK